MAVRPITRRGLKYGAGASRLPAQSRSAALSTGRAPQGFLSSSRFAAEQNVGQQAAAGEDRRAAEAALAPLTRSGPHGAQGPAERGGLGPAP